MIESAKSLKNAVLAVLISVAKFIYTLTSNPKQWRMVVFAGLFNAIQPWFQYSNRAAKLALFSELKSLQSKKRGSALKILEIGLGPSANLEFYPEGSRLTTLDPNPFFRDKVKETQAKFPRLVYEKHIVAYGEDMAEIPEDSFDVVVGTYVLCSVQKPDTVLDEIHRVLVKGGKYFFVEHISFENGAGRAMQMAAQTFLGPFVGTCECHRRSWQVIKNSQFQVEHTAFRLNYIIPAAYWPHVQGVARKI